MEYYIVLFSVDNTLEVVPASWINSERQKCYWPENHDTTFIRRAITRGIGHDDTWGNLPITKSYGPYGTLLEARQKAKRKESRLTDASSESDAPRKRKLPEKLVESTQTARNHSHKKPKFGEKGQTGLKYPAQMIISPRNSQPISMPEVQCSQPALTIQVPTPTTSRTSTVIRQKETDAENGTKDDFRGLVLSSLAAIKIRLRTVESNQELILAQLKDVRGNARKPRLLNLPVKDLNELENLEEVILKNQEAYDEVADRLDGVGGDSVRECTFKTMKKLMSDDVARELNWKGRNSKGAFQNFQLCSIVTNCVHYYFGKKTGTLTVIEGALKDWLKAAPNRVKQRKLRSNENPLKTRQVIDIPNNSDSDENITDSTPCSDEDPANGSE
ncbi:unnamed protein product [Allacma fusca]|uniref:DUF4806 domain-containing protein n=1 Tax=Allacma fusca TaxID=39272 RepID=A0A8J2K0U2_9HEXA|nr:unnamed protein product [Allacma fusca]